MKTKTIVILVLFAVVGLWAFVPAEAADGICARFEVSSVEKPTPREGGKFSAVKTTDLIVHVLFQDEIKEELVVTLRFYTPNRHLYREMDIPIAPSGTRAPGKRTLPNYPYPVEVKVPNTTRPGGEPAIEVRFPVGGTSIVSSSLYGTWTVSGLINGKELRCFRPLTITIKN
ncbi:MAG: hypothetical protein K8R59_09145 [Thermoanaerobaculales bacterium]|nr:hypothetical protein [Thermoanaerobaculales bacterium]